MALLTISTLSAFGQDTIKTEKKIKEYILTFADFSPINVSIKYKRQLKSRTFFRIGFVNLKARSTNYYPTNSTSFLTHYYDLSAGLECGLEFRKNITDNFTFFHGPNLSFTYSTNIDKSDNPALPLSRRRSITQIYDYGIPYTFGLLFHLNGHFLLSAEINPALFVYYKSPSPQYNVAIFSPSISFGNKYGLLSLVYRI